MPLSHGPAGDFLWAQAVLDYLAIYYAMCIVAHKYTYIAPNDGKIDPGLRPGSILGTSWSA